MASAVRDRGALALALTLAAIAALRALESFGALPLLWGLAAQRFLAPGVGWAVWAAGALALVPTLGRRAAAAMRGFGDALVRGSAAPAALAAALAALALLLPDRTQFLGDFSMRVGTVMVGANPAQLFPQAMPFDVALHVRLPAWLYSNANVPIEVTARALGALAVAAMALAGTSLARMLALDGAAALAVALALGASGALTLCTGYPKCAVELSALAAVGGVALLRAMRGGGAALVVGALVSSLSLGFHRSGLMLWPAALVALVFAPGDRRSTARLMAALALALGLALWGPRALELMRTFDLPHHFVSSEVRAAGGPWRAWAEPLHLLDALQCAIALAPLALALPALLFGLGRVPGRERAVLAALALPAVAMLLLLRPQQGLFRDRDVFAQAGVAFTLIAARLGGEVLRPPSRAWLAPVLALASLVPTLQWSLLMHRNLEAIGLVRAVAIGPPPRGESERAATWDFLGTDALARKEWGEAADDYRRASEAAPNPRLIAQWGMAEVRRGHLREAEPLFRRAVTLAPDITFAWLGLASTGSWNDDTPAVAEAERAITRLDPANAQLPAIRAYLARAGAAR